MAAGYESLDSGSSRFSLTVPPGELRAEAFRNFRHGISAIDDLSDGFVLEFWAVSLVESTRVYRRLRILRGLEHEPSEALFPGGQGTGRTAAV